MLTAPLRQRVDDGSAGTRRDLGVHTASRALGVGRGPDVAPGFAHGAALRGRARAERGGVRAPRGGERARGSLGAPPLEVIVVDGGGDDGTVAEARAAGAVVLTAPRGRAAQCNAGARHAKGDLLLFLHADSTLPPGYDAHLDRLFADDDDEEDAPGPRSSSLAGSSPPAFFRRPSRSPASSSSSAPRATTEWRAFEFHLGDGDGDSDPSGESARRRSDRRPGACAKVARRCLEACVDLRARLLRFPTATRASSSAAAPSTPSGFPPMPFMEDFELVSKLRREHRRAPGGGFALVPAKVTTSARRSLAIGMAKTTAVNHLHRRRVRVRGPGGRAAPMVQRRGARDGRGGTGRERGARRGGKNGGSVVVSGGGGWSPPFQNLRGG